MLLCLQTLYERVKDYMDMSARLALLNARFEFLQRMLDIWRDHANHYHLARLDVIIVVLIVLEVIMAGAEVVGFFFKL